MKHLFAFTLVAFAAGCWMEDFEAATAHNEQALDAYEQGELVEPAAPAPVGQVKVQQAIETFYADYGRYPNSLQELVPTYLPEVPTKADGTAYNYNPQTGAVSN